MRIALWLYIALFVTVCVLAFLDPDPEWKETPMEIAVDTVISVVTLAGMVAYAMRLNAPRMIAAWKFVAPAILVAFIVQLVLAWNDVPLDPELSATEQRGIVVFAMAVMALFLTPAILVNFRFARARHLDAAR